MRCGAPSHPSPTKRGVRSYSLRKKLKINFAEGYITPNVLIGWTRVTICVNRCMTFYHSALFALISHTDDVMCWLDSIYHQEIVCCEHVGVRMPVEMDSVSPCPSCGLFIRKGHPHGIMCRSRGVHAAVNTKAHTRMMRRPALVVVCQSSTDSLEHAY
jgi:hypothetical protein